MNKRGTMPERIDNDWEFARRVDELGRQGLEQAEIVEALGEKSRSAVRTRLARLGLKWEALNRVRDVRTKQYLSEILTAVGADEPAGAPA